MRRFYQIAVPLLMVTIGGLAWWIARDTPLTSGGIPASGGSFHGRGLPSASGVASGNRNTVDIRTEHRSDAGLLVLADIAESARQLNSPQASGEDDIAILHSIVTFFRTTNDGHIPGGGLNEEIVDQLRGKNPKRLVLLPLDLPSISPDLPSISPDGQLLDRWGTPYFFHPISSSVLHIRSAGPDRKLWTKDDIGDTTL